MTGDTAGLGRRARIEDAATSGAGPYPPAGAPAAGCDEVSAAKTTVLAK